MISPRQKVTELLQSLLGFKKKLLLLAISFLLVGCVIPMRPSGPWIHMPPDPGPDSVTLTLVRVNQFTGSYPIHYIVLDGTYVVTLKTGQYTQIPISQGPHELSVTRIVGGVYVVAPYAGLIGLDAQASPRNTFTAKQNEFVCQSDDTCLFAIKNFNPLSKNPVRLMRIDALEGEFSIAGKKLITPGTDQSYP